jgi:hypothetical protein
MQVVYTPFMKLPRDITSLSREELLLLVAQLERQVPN